MIGMDAVESHPLFFFYFSAGHFGYGPALIMILFQYLEFDFAYFLPFFFHSYPLLSTETTTLRQVSSKMSKPKKSPRVNLG
jgi:hypothetical protein